MLPAPGREEDNECHVSWDDLYIHLEERGDSYSPIAHIFKERVYLVLCVDQNLISFLETRLTLTHSHKKT